MVDNKYYIKTQQDDLFEEEIRFRSRNRIEMVMRFYIMIGLVVAFLGSVYFVYISLDIKLDSNQINALGIAFSGLAIAVTSWGYLSFKKKRFVERQNLLRQRHSLNEIYYLWSEFEKVSKKLLDTKGVSYNRNAIRNIINTLESEAFIDSEGVQTLENARVIRNEVAHGGVNFSEQVLFNAKSSLIDLIDELSLQH